MFLWYNYSMKHYKTPRETDVCEAYTSKTVSWTGELVANLGGSKVIKSSEGQSMDRDLNGARGIFIKTVARALTVRPYLA